MNLGPTYQNDPQSGLLLRPDPVPSAKGLRCRLLSVWLLRAIQGWKMWEVRGELPLPKKNNPKSSQPYILFWCSSFPVTEIRRTPDEVPFWVDDCLVRRAPREESGKWIIKGFYFDNACSLSCSIVISLALHNCHSMFSRPLCAILFCHRGTRARLKACLPASLRVVPRTPWYRNCALGAVHRICTSLVCFQS